MPISPWLITFAEYLERASNILVLVPLGMAGWRWPHLPSALRLLACYLVFTEATLLAAALTEMYWPRWHLLVWQAFTITETLFFFRIYYLTLRVPLWRRFIVVAAPLFAAFALLDTFYLEGMHQVNAFTHVLQSALLIGLALLYFEQLLNELEVVRLEHDPLFLVSTAVVLYFSGTVLMYVFINHFLTAKDYASNQVVYTINSIVNLIQYSLFALAFWYADRKPQAPVHS
ncbi:hypothetical protein [Hymenobacter persicinus]|uniref:Uncharacterized protein n=1 Tax=Hymenobacter persicinus TaxID=2025506 RepID=A0A4Q5LE02_9BACT|nr:hypothetical protein [Hymenobacter persicinus]RYU82182.1 hypothetical protein EWM57_05215 [Hymenobacter persicinus]